MYNLEKYLKIEDIDPIMTYEEYLKSYINNNNRLVLENFIEKIIQQELLYEEIAKNRGLYQFQSKVDDNSALKVALLNLYKNQLSKTNSYKHKKYYNEIVKIAKNGKCPYCSIGYVFPGNATLDHFLPKSKFPELSVSLINLVPCCMDCNKHKGEIFNEDEKQQFIQPYFDNINSERWLFVEFNFNFSQLNYVIRNDNGLDDVLIDRIKFQFKKLKIYEKYEIQAIDELREKLNIVNSDNSKLIALLEEFNDSYNRINVLNSWKKALYARLRELTIEECQILMNNFK